MGFRELCPGGWPAGTVLPAPLSPCTRPLSHSDWKLQSFPFRSTVISTCETTEAEPHL